MPTPIEFLETAFREFEETDRPFVTVSYAQSLDGSLTRRRGEPTRLSGDEAMRLTHALRAWHDGILVGAGTVAADDPQLTVRLVAGESPRPVVLDTELNVSLSARVFGNSSGAMVICGPVTESRRDEFRHRGVEVYPVGRAAGGVDLREALAAVRGAGITRMMVEGGARVIASFLLDRLVDAAVITLAPVLLGGLRAEGHGVEGGMPRLVNASMEGLGNDWVAWGRLMYDGD